jgi:hypothetical protein
MWTHAFQFCGIELCSKIAFTKQVHKLLIPWKTAALVSVPFTEGRYCGGEERPNKELARNSLPAKQEGWYTEDIKNNVLIAPDRRRSSGT